MESLMGQVLQRGAFEQRSHLGALVGSYHEMFGDEYGKIVAREGDVLFIQVKGAPLRSELENFKKWDLLELLHDHKEFSGIRDLKFKE
jgi:hypothetical protein